MAWTYSAFESEATDAARLTMLRQHIGEVRAKMGVDTNGADMAVAFGSLQQYIDSLDKRRMELERKVARTNAPMMAVARFPKQY